MVGFGIKLFVNDDIVSMTKGTHSLSEYVFASAPKGMHFGFKCMNSHTIRAPSPIYSLGVYDDDIIRILMEPIPNLPELSTM